MLALVNVLVVLALTATPQAVEKRTSWGAGSAPTGAPIR